MTVSSVFCGQGYHRYAIPTQWIASLFIAVAKLGYSNPPHSGSLRFRFSAKQILSCASPLFSGASPLHANPFLRFVPLCFSFAKLLTSVPAQVVALLFQHGSSRCFSAAVHIDEMHFRLFADLRLRTSSQFRCCSLQIHFCLLPVRCCAGLCFSMQIRFQSPTCRANPMHLTSELFSAVAFQRTFPDIESLSFPSFWSPLQIVANPTLRFSGRLSSDAVLC